VLVPNGFFVVGVIVLVALVLGLWVVALSSIWRRPDAEMRSTGIPRVAWLVLTVAFGPLVAVAYLVTVRLRLRART
jgi:uncharacterized membrane protein YkvI